jgi:very-short-patch-repair endonuclease
MITRGTVLARGPSCCSSRKNCPVPFRSQSTISASILDFVSRAKSSLRFALDGNIHVQSAENAFQNTDFLPIARNYHR